MPLQSSPPARPYQGRRRAPAAEPESMPSYDDGASTEALTTLKTGLTTAGPLSSFTTDTLVLDRPVVAPRTRREARGVAAPSRPAQQPAPAAPSRPAPRTRRELRELERAAGRRAAVEVPAAEEPLVEAGRAETPQVQPRVQPRVAPPPPPAPSGTLTIPTFGTTEPAFQRPAGLTTPGPGASVLPFQQPAGLTTPGPGATVLPFQQPASRRAARAAAQPAPAARPSPEPMTRAEARRLLEQQARGGSRGERTMPLAAAGGAAGVLALTALAAQALSGAAGAPTAAADTGASTGRGAVAADGALFASALPKSVVATPTPAPPPRVLPVSRSVSRPPLPGCDGKVPTAHFANGRIPLSDLCKLPFAPGHRLRADAAVALARLNAAYRATFGRNICVTDSYRSLASQEDVAARKPGLAARPGTSEHGWGLAVDLCDGIEEWGTTEHVWMQVNGPFFGWNNPGWAQPGGNRPEPWHWEYTPGER